MKDKHQVFLSLGTNMGDKAANLSKALKCLAMHQVEIYKVSGVFESVPWGITNQSNFYNIVLSAGYSGTPYALLKDIHEMENAMGRSREVRWGPRIIDIDILSFQDTVVSSDDLIIPHKYLKQRAFVLIPFAEICPDYRLPNETKTIVELLEALPDSEVSGVKRISAK